MTLLSADIETAATLLKEGKLVAIPTETVYGLAANIFDEDAVRAIFELKKRPLFNPLNVHVHSFEQVEELTKAIPPKAQILMDAIWPGELTLVLPKKAIVPDLITAGKDTVAVRMPKHALIRELLQQIDFPIAAPSANPFSSISPTNAERVKNYFNGALPLVLDGGSCSSGIESTIVGFENDEPVVYRLGALAIEDIERLIGPVKQITKSEKSPQAPGMLLKHYSPNTPLLLLDNISKEIEQYADQKIGILVFQNDLKHTSIHHTEILSPRSDFKEASTKLYEALHRLDAAKVDLILAERLPNEQLGKSINDRLERAAVKY